MAPLVVTSAYWSDHRAASSAFTAGSRRSISRPGKLPGRARNIGPDDAVLATARHVQALLRPRHEPRPDELARRHLAAGRRPGVGLALLRPELDLVYYGTGNPGPYNAEQREGDNKWTSSVLARRPGDGSLVWAYQFTPHDNWDYDANRRERSWSSSMIRGTRAQGAGALRQERLCLHA